MNHTARQEWRRQGRGRYWLGFAIGLGLLAGLTFRLWADFVFITPAPRRVLTAEYAYGAYRVRLYDVWEDPADTDWHAMSFEILRDGQCVFSEDGWRLQVCGTNDPPDPRGEGPDLPPIGSDITGDGQPDLVIYDYSGGAHCCSSFFLFEIGDTFRHIQTLDAAHSGAIGFVNLDEDSAVEILLLDWSYAYRWTCFACSPAPEVVLNYDGAAYEPDEALMRAPPPSPAALQALAAEIRQSEDWSPDRPGPAPDMIGHMLDLVYSGNRFHAWVLMEMVWPGGGDYKEAFAADFEQALSETPYASAVDRLNESLAWWPEATPAPILAP